ncbi:MAG: 23S rRNA (pseudouridine(1915)-N(3))-methyltransferase RlmH [Thermoanaerobaculum sp.]
MRQATLIYVGRSAEAPWEALCAIYRRRLQRLLAWQERRVPLAEGRKTDPHGALLREAKAVLASLSGRETLVALDERGELWHTEDLATFLGEQLAARPVVFVIGSDLGLHAEVLARAQVWWSLSPLTLPHELVRLVVMEQLYRALDLLAGGSYHRSTRLRV